MQGACLAGGLCLSGDWEEDGALIAVVHWPVILNSVAIIALAVTQLIQSRTVKRLIKRQDKAEAPPPYRDPPRYK
jgi:hypothetical protein